MAFKHSDFTIRETMMHQSWCHKNDIIMYYQPVDYLTGNIVIEEKGKKYITNELFRQPTKKKPLKTRDKRWWIEIKKMYTSKYLEYNK